MGSEVAIAYLGVMSSPSELAPAVPGEVLSVAFESGPIRLYAHGPAASGTARPVLLVHSLNAAASAYEVRPLYEDLSRSRPTYALDLPGFGGSARPARRYTPRLLCDAIAAVLATLRARSSADAMDLVGVSTGCELVARLAYERPRDVHALALISPTGLDRRGPRRGPPGSTLGLPWLRAVLEPWGRPLFRLLTRPAVIRYFLERTFGGRVIDEGLFEYAVRTAAVEGAEHAPISFLCGELFSADVTTLYEGLEVPVWVAHGTRGDFTDYSGLAPLVASRGFGAHVYEAGALPFFERRDEVVADLERFLAAPEEMRGRHVRRG
jgi:pimeloyl-ACP methyl ester carboxylesterase